MSQPYGPFVGPNQAAASSETVAWNGPPPSADAVPPQQMPLSQPTRRKRNGWRIALLVGGGAIVVIALLGFIVIPPIMEDYPATLTNSERVAGMPKLHDPSLIQLGDRIARQMQLRGSASSTMASFYAPAGDNGHIVAVVAMTRLTMTPRSEIEDIFREVSNDELAVSNVHEVPAGKQGGYVKCGSGEAKSDGSGIPISMCAWADYGSSGLGIFFNRSVDESVPLFITIRSEIVHHA